MVDLARLRRVLVERQRRDRGGRDHAARPGEELRARGSPWRTRATSTPRPWPVRSPPPPTAPAAASGTSPRAWSAFGWWTARGELRACGDELRAAGEPGRTGAITAAASCVPAFSIHRIDEPRPLDVLSRLDELVDAHDHFEAFVMPYTRRALTLRSERTDREPEPPGRVGAFVHDAARERCAGARLPPGTRFPA